MSLRFQRAQASPVRAGDVSIIPATSLRRVFLSRAVATTSLAGTAAAALAQTKVEEADDTAVGLG